MAKQSMPLRRLIAGLCLLSFSPRDLYPTNQASMHKLYIAGGISQNVIGAGIVNGGRESGSYLVVTSF